MKHPAHIMVIYDGIANSVFEGQVLAPLIAYRSQFPDTPITLISFEKNTTAHLSQALRDRLNTHSITLIIARKYPLLHRVTLTLAAWQLRRILSAYTHYTLTARGPLAGYLGLTARTLPACTSLKIQARGLLAAEYEYATQETRGLAGWYHRYKIALFTRIEQYVYAPHPLTIIEAVSPALKDYLLASYTADPAHSTIAQHDIPELISPAQKHTWRATTRTALNIQDNAHVYCYNGSAKAWQCPQQTVAYFHDQWKNNPNSFLLILTQDVAQFEKLIGVYQLPATSYQILHVPHTQIYQFLAACDTGIIFRDAHIINWISRPTKILEYQAVGLTIVHNQTIAMLVSDAEIHRMPQSHSAH